MEKRAVGSDSYKMHKKNFRGNPCSQRVPRKKSSSFSLFDAAHSKPPIIHPDNIDAISVHHLNVEFDKIKHAATNG